jgi:pimeloyl-ACP methyl ester carboxylesterase
LYALGWLWAYLETLQGYYVPKTVTQDYSLPQVRVNGHRLHLVAYGDSVLPCVIVLHDGPGADSRELQALAHLRDSFRVVLFDQWGTGLSERALALADSLEPTTPCPYTVQTLLNDLHVLVGRYATPTHKPWLLGKGLGGVLALAYAQSHPEALDGIVWLAPRGLPSGSNPAASHRQTGWPQVQQLFWAHFERKHIRYAGDPHAPEDHEATRYWALWDSTAFCPGCLPHRYPLLWRAGAAHARCLAQELFTEAGEYRTRWDSVSRALYPLPIALLGVGCSAIAPGTEPSCFPLLDQPQATLAAIRAVLRQPRALAGR